MTEEVIVEVSANGAPPAERRALTVAQIREAPPDCREEWVEVPEWGGWIKLRSPTALGSAEIKSAGLKIDAEGQTIGMDIPAMERAQMKYGVADPALTDEDVVVMQEKFGPSWNRVMVVLDRLTGPLGKAGMKEAELLKETENNFREG
jgi:hypothetical protein